MKNEKIPPPDKREQYEDALFGLLMEDFARREGQRLEELEQQGLPPLPEGLQQRLEAELDKQWRRRGKGRHRLRRVLSKAAIVALILAAGFAALYTNVDAFRDKMRQLVMEYTDVSINFSTEDVAGVGLQGNYAPTWVPEGYEIASAYHGRDDVFIEYRNEKGGNIIFGAHDNDCILGIDSEDTDFIKDIKIHGNTGKMIGKQGRIEIVWHSSEAGSFFTILSSDISEREVVKMAKSVKFIN